jgi:hypothetical protein
MERYFTGSISAIVNWSSLDHKLSSSQRYTNYSRTKYFLVEASLSSMPFDREKKELQTDI